MPNRVIILDFGRKAGLVDDNGNILCDWPVTLRETPTPTIQTPRKSKKEK